MFAVARLVLPSVRRLRRRAHPVVQLLRRLRGVAAAVRVLPKKLGAPRRQRRLEHAVNMLPPPPEDDRRVSVIVLTHDGRPHLERLLPAFRRTTAHPDVELIIVDNGSGSDTRSYLESLDGVEVVRSDRNRSFSEANGLGAAQARGEVLCFLNDDVEPISPGWLRRMLRELRDDVVAVGAQLVYPRRGLLASSTVDLTVQHLGTRFEPRPGGMPQAVNVGGGEPDPRRPAFDVPAATAATLLVDRQAFEAAGGFDERYEYGAEDVDLCWRLARAGGRVRIAPDALLYHHEGATRHKHHPRERSQRQERNWDRLAQRFGPEIRRAVELDRLAGGGELATEPYSVGITITRDLESAGYGDWYTAHELGAELEKFGWDVRYVEKYRDAWYSLPHDLDAVVVLLDTYDIRRVARPGLTTVAWVRNWGARWANHPWFDDYDVVLASSGHMADRLRETTRHARVEVLPLATNPERFRPRSSSSRQVVLPANHWGHDRGVEELVSAVPDLHLLGKGWDGNEAVSSAWRGHVEYTELPAVYAEALLVVDRAAGHTRDDRSVNARVFDALAAGTLVATDQIEGVRELFGEDVPTYRTPDELAELVAQVRRDPHAFIERTQRLRDQVLTQHTYAVRAARLQQILGERAELPSFCLKIGAPDRSVAHTWGDLHLAEALGRELHARGSRIRVQTMDEWDDRGGYADDVVIHLKGRGRVQRAEGQIHVIWNISHPDELTDEEAEDADLLLVAGRRFVEELSRRTSTPVHELLQATDPFRFRPHPPDDRYRHDLAFVGNSKFTYRPAVAAAIEADLRPAIYGANWERYVDPDLIRSTHVANEELPTLYSSVRVLLNDHWDDMRKWGFVSNRIFDVLATGGAVVVSDELDELHELFGEVVSTYRTPDDLRATVDHLLQDDERRRKLAAEGRDLVLSGHTFAHRVDPLLGHLEPLLEERQSRSQRGRP